MPPAHGGHGAHSKCSCMDHPNALATKCPATTKTAGDLGTLRRVCLKIGNFNEFHGSSPWSPANNQAGSIYPGEGCLLVAHKLLSIENARVGLPPPREKDHQMWRAQGLETLSTLHTGYRTNIPAISNNICCYHRRTRKCCIHWYTVMDCHRLSQTVPIMKLFQTTESLSATAATCCNACSANAKCQCTEMSSKKSRAV